MSAIEFVVRNDAGGLQRGAVSGNGQDANIIVSQGQDVSLNLQRSHVLSYARQGQALQVMLVDGQVITIQGFFGPDGTPLNDLFLSSGGQLAQVQLVPGDGNLLLAQYIDEDGFGKWSPDDDLYFIEVASLDIAGTETGADVGMLGVPLLAGLGGIGGGAAAAGAAALGGIALLGGSSAESDDGDTDGGTQGGGGDGTPGGGGDEGGGENGDGGGGGGGTGGDGGDSAPEIVISGGTRSTGTVVNGEDWDDGVEISGTGTPNASATLVINGSTIPFDIDDNGQWSVTVPTNIAGEGEYSYEVVATVTTGGGTSSATDFLDVDTVNEITLDTSAAGGDGTVNLVERNAVGVLVTGTAEANATVTVTFNGNGSGNITHTTQADGNGNWTYTFSGAEVPGGEYQAAVSATSTDAAGNAAFARGTVEVDTLASVDIREDIVGGNGVINHIERGAQTIDITGQADAFSEVRVTFENGSKTVVAGEDGSWTANFSTSVIRSGNVETFTTITAVATDPAGNVVTDQADVRLDTWVNRLTLNSPVEGADNTVNRAEASDGVTLTGTVERGATEVIVRFDASQSGTPSAIVTRAATVDANGNWSVSYAAGEIPDGTYQANVTVAAKDLAGNSRSINGQFDVDTDVPDAPSVEGIGDYDRGVTFVTIDGNPDDIRVHSYDEGGNGRSLIATDGDGMKNFPADGEETFSFDAPVVDGKQLVITATDDAGNSNSTLLVVDVNGVVNLNAAGLDTFNIGAIDLDQGDNARLTLTKESIDALSNNDNVLVVHGSIDDSVTFNGNAAWKETQQIDGRSYDVYSLGDDSELVIDSSIAFSQNVV
ncbi:hypothetical protein SAMN05428995_103476 [Loktanella sp. DSM 29012]|uniref:BapA/Bap/LapF family prefix-like domain-containing protein n=1 Tax=Loktanella sp. DSM 29012 TaxID=1881056 RepID=UPI0008B8FFD3|nr:hypothetical protein [Loktanella sp. DSM 29012]SEQ29105.1 hypothetical protein SAMN05428995_103476 [Loktanella sp. DSM 29012]